LYRIRKTEKLGVRWDTGRGLENIWSCDGEGIDISKKISMKLKKSKEFSSDW
jgi:hypothetical protein